MSIQRYIKPIVVLLAISLIAGCTLKNPTNPQLPSWIINLEFPLIKDHVTLKELASDSLITTIPPDYQGSGLSDSTLFAFRDSFPIDSVEVGDQLEMDDVHKSFSQTVDDVTIASDQKEDQVGFEEVTLDDVSKGVTTEVGTIELDDTDPKQSDRFTFRNIMPQAVVQALETQTQSGPTTVDSVEGGDLRPNTKSFQFESFQSVELQEGQLVLTIHNNMFIPLGEPITVSLLYDNADSTQFAQAVFDEHIPEGGSATRTIDLAGDSLGSDILIHITGESDGSQGQQVTVENSDLDTGFYVEVSAENLVATEADAKIPSQTINQDSEIELATSDNKIEEARLREGSLIIEIANNMNVDSDVTLTIPSLVNDAGDVYERGPFSVPANQTVSQTYSIAGQTMVMDTANQVVEYSYEVVTVNTENDGNTSSDYETINQNDSVNVQIDLTDMTISQILGVLEEKRTEETDNIPITSENEILRATIQEGDITLDINNQIGGDPNLELKFHQIFESPGSSDTLTRNIDINPGQNTAVIDLSGRQIRMPQNDQNLYYTTITTGGGVYAQYNLEDSIFVTINVSELTISEATGYFTQDAMVEEDTIALNSDSKVKEAVIQSGNLAMTITNRIGVEANVRLILEEFYSNGTSLDTVIAMPDNDTPVVRNIPLDNYTIKMPLDDQNIHYTSRTRIPPDSLMTLTLGDSIDVDVDITNVSFSEIEGEIDPVSINIDPVEQSVTGIPEELKGVKFNHVDMKIDFDTNIGIPVFLDLTIKSYNADGDSVINDEIRSWNIADSSTVIIPNAEDLINIFPDRIVASGQATAGAPGAVGTVASNQFVAGQINITAPLEFEITDDAVVELDPQKVDPIEAETVDRIRQFTLYARMENQFEFGADVQVMVAQDTMTFESGSTIIPDTLATLHVPAMTEVLDSISLDTTKFAHFKDSSYVKTRVMMLERPDGQPSRFLSTDSLKMTLYGTVRYLNDHLQDNE
ncbi:MAG: hypothetical protein K9N46_00655 [Candidatus Marinimicrobia bacterium]|nr:hypothetical protein [Candidatus Neomarinimicrobiota bacterium]MCF7828014.1 hypothetical protein [Candidatus Neomarinimicrobiota bacterium]MCF7879231.1 hypothetical protein [Candidatus Neomarinimicrobiota bacterium]